MPDPDLSQHDTVLALISVCICSSGQTLKVANLARAHRTP